MLRFLDGDNGVKSVAKHVHVHVWVNTCLQGLQSVQVPFPSQLMGGFPPDTWRGSLRAQSERAQTLAPTHFWLESGKDKVERLSC